MKSDRTFFRGGFGLMKESEELGGARRIHINTFSCLGCLG